MMTALPVRLHDSMPGRFSGVVPDTEAQIAAWSATSPYPVRYGLPVIRQVRARGREPVIAQTAVEHAAQSALVAAGPAICMIPRLGRDPLPQGGHRVFLGWKHGIRLYQRRVHVGESDTAGDIATAMPYRGDAC